MPMFLAITEDETPGCPAGSAIGRFELGEAVAGRWPGLVLVPDDGRELWQAPLLPSVASMPLAVPNADLRIVLQRRFLPDGRSYFSAADAYLAGQHEAVAQLPDDDLRKQDALAAWTQWDMGNMFYRADPLVAQLGAMFGLTGPELDDLFRAAAARA